MTEDTTSTYDADDDELESLKRRLDQFEESQKDPVLEAAREQGEDRARRQAVERERQAENARDHRRRAAAKPAARLLGEIEERLAKLPAALDTLAAYGAEDETVPARILLIAADVDELTRYQPDPAKAIELPTTTTTTKTPAEAIAAANAKIGERKEK